MRLTQSYIEYNLFSLFKINISNLIQIKAALAKNFHIQPSEIDKMPMWEYEMFLDELNKLVKEENNQQQSEMDKYHVKDYMNAANPKNIQKMASPKMPKMPDFSKGFKM